MRARGAAVLLVTAGLAFLSRPASGRDRVLRTGKPESVGMSSATLADVSRLLRETTGSGYVLGASILVARRGVVVLHAGFGKTWPDASGTATQPDTVYPIASITKAVTAAAVMQLVDQGRVSLADPVRKYLPEFRGERRDEVLVRDILSHVSGLPDMIAGNDELRRRHAALPEFVKAAMTTPLLFPPRTRFNYQSTGILMAGEIVERTAGMGLRDYMKQHLFAPLGMDASSLGLGGRSLRDLAWCQDAPGQSVEAQLAGSGVNSEYGRDVGFPWGSMQSTTHDLAVFLQMFLNGGVYAGKRVLSAATVRAMTSNQNDPKLPPWGLGWGFKQSRGIHHLGDFGSDRKFGHTGSTGTVAWADPERELVFVLLTSRPADDDDDGSLRRRLSNLVDAAVLTP